MMVAQALRFRLFGWLAPQVASNSATVNGVSLVIPLTQGTPLAGAVTPSQFTVLVNGVSRGVSAATVAGQNCTLTLASAVTNGQAVKASYAGGGAAPLKNAAGELTPPFSINVTNNTP
jgi:uncharacterized repeat protein (TIGR02059 family)